MAILNPEHLLEQAEKLIVSPAAGRPRQVDLRRAISAAYYAVFHAILTAAADKAIAALYRSSPQYALVYRNIAHKTLRDLCSEVQKTSLSAKYRHYEPVGGFDRHIRVFAAGAVELQDARHAADYDPLLRVKSADARLAIDTGRSALARLERAQPEHRERFLNLLLFPPR